jgi:hypothetical protein
MPVPQSFKLSLPSGVRPIAREPLRFWVVSRSRGKVEHLVDLEENGFNGKCSCELYQFKIAPRLREERTSRETSMRLRCWHIRRAMFYLAELTMRTMANKDPRARRDQG